MRLLRYAVRRFLVAILTLFVLATLTFFVMRAVPGDPLMKTKEIPEETRRNLEARYGLDKPLFQQYLIQMEQIFLKGNFGTSFRTLGREVNDIIKEQFPASASIGLVAVAGGLFFGLILGTLAALYRNSIIDRTAMLICVIGASLPSFLFGYLFQYFIAVIPLTQWGINPEHWVRPAGYGELRDLLLPGLTLGLFINAVVTRLMRSQMVDVSFSDYVKTAKAKGVSTQRLIFKHQMRNALMPVITIIGPLFASTLTGSLIIEGIYGIPGLGNAYINSITNNDYNVIMGLTIFYGGFIILVNFVTDILYGVIDPRVRVSK